MTPGSALTEFLLHLKQHLHVRNLLKLKLGVFTLASLKIALTHGALAQVFMGKILLAKLFLAQIM